MTSIFFIQHFHTVSAFCFFLAGLLRVARDQPMHTRQGRAARRPLVHFRTAHRRRATDLRVAAGCPRFVSPFQAPEAAWSQRPRRPRRGPGRRLLQARGAWAPCRLCGPLVRGRAGGRGDVPWRRWRWMLAKTKDVALLRLSQQQQKGLLQPVWRALVSASTSTSTATGEQECTFGALQARDRPSSRRWLPPRFAGRCAVPRPPTPGQCGTGRRIARLSNCFFTGRFLAP